MGGTPVPWGNTRGKEVARRSTRTSTTAAARLGRNGVSAAKLLVAITSEGMSMDIHNKAREMMCLAYPDEPGLEATKDSILEFIGDDSDLEAEYQGYFCQARASVMIRLAHPDLREVSDELLASIIGGNKALKEEHQSYLAGPN